jgi:hypothetical protein
MSGGEIRTRSQSPISKAVEKPGKSPDHKFNSDAGLFDVGPSAPLARLAFLGHCSPGVR